MTESWNKCELTCLYPDMDNLIKLNSGSDTAVRLAFLIDLRFDALNPDVMTKHRGRWPRSEAKQLQSYFPSIDLPQ
jgi:hypothetical protein